ncbi:hypothetical protein QV65_08255 [Rhodococcus erythropolis]|nr:hypothetical protein QV65_08255 [Rhodococcus erythropolis]
MKVWTVANWPVFAVAVSVIMAAVLPIGDIASSAPSPAAVTRINSLCRQGAVRMRDETCVERERGELCSGTVGVSLGMPSAGMPPLGGPSPRGAGRNAIINRVPANNPPAKIPIGPDSHAST